MNFFTTPSFVLQPHQLRSNICQVRLYKPIMTHTPETAGTNRCKHALRNSASINGAISGRPNRPHYRSCRSSVRLSVCLSVRYRLVTKDYKRSNLSKAHETRDSLSSSCLQVVLIYLYPFRRNSLLKSTPQPQIAPKH